MKRLLYILWWTVALCLASLAGGSCVGVAPAWETHLVDSLNRESYAWRYKSLEHSRKAALKAYRAADFYRQGKAEACNNLGFCAFMRMDFERAGQCHREVYSLTKNELELLIADIGMMKIYQRTARNKDFYDCRNAALRRMKRIDEDGNLFTDSHERTRVAYARTEFHIVSTVYHYYLNQRTEALASINEIAENEALAADTNQLLHYHYLKGSASLCDGETFDERRLKEFDELYFTWRQASRKGYPYFEGNGAQGLADLMASPAGYRFFAGRRPHALRQFGEPSDSLLPLRMARLALDKFRQYGDPYQIVGTYVSIGKSLNGRGEYGQALDTLTRALEYAGAGQTGGDVPEWISGIREQLSVAYAGLGMKEHSDYNRNIYLDILEDTRQDKELESRYHALEKEEAQLNLLLFLVLAGLAGVLLFFWLFSRHSEVRNRLHLRRLQSVLDICRRITASIPADARSEKEMAESIFGAIYPELKQLFGTESIHIKEGRLTFGRHVRKREQAMAQVIDPYIQWTLDNGSISASLDMEQRRLEKQRYVHQQHIARNKRQNVVKKACFSIVNGIHPYIDRILNEAHKLIRMGYIHDETIKKEKYQYIDELVTTINEYNDILALWIKMKRGALSLEVENFELNELFALLRKGSHAFEMKRITLLVEPTDVCIKADKALTLFMINTLAENARKYTPRGGKVKIYARAEEDYVEISVEDTGYGLSPEDVARIVGEKVYDSQTIGMSGASHPEELRKSKGSGFGLMNCKGIIEKYKKTNPLFNVCQFNVESVLGHGSRFSFRLPAGARKALALLLLAFSFGITSCAGGGCADEPEELPAGSPPSDLQTEYVSLLNRASDYANDAYYCNVAGDYAFALQYIDSAMICLNNHYGQYAETPRSYMTLTGNGTPAELEWWNENFASDFHVILDIRNEAAVSCLALKRWGDYAYNNEAYASLYKLLGEDQSLESFCQELERSTDNKLISLLLLVFLLVTLCFGYYVLYLRRRLSERWNLEQVLEVNKQVFAASTVPVSDNDEMLQREEDTLKNIPQRIVDNAFDAVNELFGISRLTLAVHNEASGRLEFASHPQEEGAGAGSSWEELARRCFDGQAHLREDGAQALPLIVKAGDSSRCIGALCLVRSNPQRDTDALLLELIARYMSIVVFNAVVKFATKYRDIEVAQDEARRASWEESLLHVQNMVLDNCLSTIKHETLYYPSRIKLLIGRLRSCGLAETEERDTVLSISELIEYYKEVFSILSRCASRQLEEVAFRRSPVSVGELMEAARKHFRKASKGIPAPILFRAEAPDETVTGDADQLRFLLENLIDEVLSVPVPGEITITGRVEGMFVRFLFTDTRRNKDTEELNRLFYPDAKRMAMDERGGLHGTEYLVCKQIIREHDEFAGRRGCRINACPATGGGFTVYFTLPRCEKKQPARIGE